MQKQKTKVKVVYRYRPRPHTLSAKLKGYWRELKQLANSPTARRAVKLMARAGKRSSEGSAFSHSPLRPEDY
jgi:hypothetical protein